MLLRKYSDGLPLANFPKLVVTRDHVDVEVSKPQLNDAILLLSGEQSKIYLVLKVEGDHVFISDNPLIDLTVDAPVHFQ